MPDWSILSFILCLLLNNSLATALPPAASGHLLYFLSKQLTQLFQIVLRYTAKGRQMELFPPQPLKTSSPVGMKKHCFTWVPQVYDSKSHRCSSSPVTVKCSCWPTVKLQTLVWKSPTVDAPPPHHHHLHRAPSRLYILFSEHKVDAVLLLWLRKMRVPAAEALTTIYKMTPLPPPRLDSLPRSPPFHPPPSLSASS